MVVKGIFHFQILTGGLFPLKWLAGLFLNGFAWKVLYKWSFIIIIIIIIIIIT